MKTRNLALLSLVTLTSSITAYSQVGTGWTPIPWTDWGVNTAAGGNRKIHFEQNGPTDNRDWFNRAQLLYGFNRTSPSTIAGTYQYDPATETEIFRQYGPPSQSLNRTEIRVQENYGQGQIRQLEGYVTINSQLSDEQAFLQIWGFQAGSGRATLLQLRGKDGIITGAGGGRPTRLFDTGDMTEKEFKLNVIHRQESSSTQNGRVQVYIDGRLFIDMADSNVSNHRDDNGDLGGTYFKYGCYGTVETGEQNARVTWKNARYFRGGNFPGTSAQTITFPALPSIPLNGGDVTPSATSTSSLPVSYRSDDLSVARIVDGKIRPVRTGTARIWAYQDGNGTFAPARVVVREITVTSGGTVQQSQSINFAPLSAKLASDAPFALSATATSGLPVSFASSNASVATISGNTVTIVGAGTTNITATQAGNASFLAATPVVRQLVVNPATVAVSGVSVSPTSLSLTVGATGSLTATVSPANATNKSVTWSSSAPAIATVSASGVVTAQSVGTASITARTTDGNFAASSAVTVTSSTTPPTGGTPITAPFRKDGTGDFTWVFTPEPGKFYSFNSWLLTKLEINGVDVTNRWASTNPTESGTAPAPINGKYTIRYISASPHSAFLIEAR